METPNLTNAFHNLTLSSSSVMSCSTTNNLVQIFYYGCYFKYTLDMLFPLSEVPSFLLSEQFWFIFLHPALRFPLLAFLAYPSIVNHFLLSTTSELNSISFVFYKCVCMFEIQIFICLFFPLDSVYARSETLFQIFNLRH